MPREASLPSSSSSLWRRPLRLSMLVAGILLVASMGYYSWRIYRHVSALQVRIAELRTLDPGSLDTVGPHLRALRQDLTLLRGDLGLLLAIAPRLGWLPGIGPTLSAAPQLALAGDLLLGATITAWDALEAPVQAMVQGEATDEAFASLAPRQAHLQAAAADVHRAVDHLKSLDAGRLLPRLGRPLARLQPLTPLLEASFDGLALLPVLVSRSEKQNFLLLAQNNDELRPAGGFTSSIGLLQLRRGVPQALTLADSYQAENWNKPHPDPPEPFFRYMGIDLWTTRDGNWWPDFPTSARAVADLYTLNQDRPIAGVIAVNTYAAERLLEALTPLQLPDGRVVQAGGVAEMFRQSWGLDPQDLLTGGVVITATQPFVAVELELSLSKRAGQAWFDSIVLEDQRRPGTNLVRNPSLENDGDGDRLPDAWLPDGFTETDGLVADVAHDGQRSLRLVGDLDSEKRLTQRIALRGDAGTRLRLNGVSRADNVNTGGGPYALSITLLREGDAPNPQRVSAGFAPLTHDWASAGSARILGDWWTHRKDFMNLSMEAAAQKLLGDPSMVRWLDVLDTFADMLDQRQIQLYMDDPAWQEMWLRYGWSGTLSTTTGDYLLVVDANVGYNKVSASLEQAIAYSVEIQENRAVGEVVVRYRNGSTTPVATCDKDKQYLPTYEALTQGCYWGYLRVYVPVGVELLSAEGGDEAFETLAELGRTAYATSLELAPGDERQLRLRYVLPDRILAEDHYSLMVQKQSGTVAIPLQVRIAGPNLAPLIDNVLQPEGSSTEELLYRTDLLVDRQIGLHLVR